jgi:hypothetical protein
MGRALVLSQNGECAGGGLSEYDPRDFFAEAPVFVPVEGVTPLPGESWRAYSQRVADLLRERSSATASRAPSPTRPGAVCFLAAYLTATNLVILIFLAVGALK